MAQNAVRHLVFDAEGVGVGVDVGVAADRAGVGGVAVLRRSRSGDDRLVGVAGRGIALDDPFVAAVRAEVRGVARLGAGRRGRSADGVRVVAEDRLAGVVQRAVHAGDLLIQSDGVAAVAAVIVALRLEAELVGRGRTGGMAVEAEIIGRVALGVIDADEGRDGAGDDVDFRRIGALARVAGGQCRAGAETAEILARAVLQAQTVGVRAGDRLDLHGADVGRAHTRDLVFVGIEEGDALVVFVDRRRGKAAVEDVGTGGVVGVDCDEEAAALLEHRVARHADVAVDGRRAVVVDVAVERVQRRVFIGQDIAGAGLQTRLGNAGRRLVEGDLVLHPADEGIAVEIAGGARQGDDVVRRAGDRIAGNAREGQRHLRLRREGDGDRHVRGAVDVDVRAADGDGAGALRDGHDRGIVAADRRRRDVVGVHARRAAFRIRDIDRDRVRLQKPPGGVDRLRPVHVAVAGIDVLGRGDDRIGGRGGFIGVADADRALGGGERLGDVLVIEQAAGDGEHIVFLTGKGDGLGVAVDDLHAFRAQRGGYAVRRHTEADAHIEHIVGRVGVHMVRDDRAVDAVEFAGVDHVGIDGVVALVRRLVVRGIQQRLDGGHTARTGVEPEVRGVRLRGVVAAAGIVRAAVRVEEYETAVLQGVGDRGRGRVLHRVADHAAAGRLRHRVHLLDVVGRIAREGRVIVVRRA